MFTGIIESVGQVEHVKQEQQNVHFKISSSISDELKVDQSVAHNGVCLTVTKLEPGAHWVTAINETLQKTNLGTWQAGSPLNLERAMGAHARFDGHMVQGHADTTGTCLAVADEGGSWRFTLQHPEKQEFFTVEKGSICINGVSLTVVNSQRNQFEVTIIPYTWEHTTFNSLKAGDAVNLEFDIIGKYLNRLMTHYLPKA
jgi:riboflavin synthase